MVQIILWSFMKKINGIYEFDEYDKWKFERFELVEKILYKLYKKPNTVEEIRSKNFIYHRNQIFDWIYKHYKNENIEFLRKLWNVKLREHEIKEDFK